MTRLRARLFSLAFYAWTAALALLAMPLLLAPRRLLIGYGCYWVRGLHVLLRITVGLRHEVRGQANMPHGPAILAVKHQSAWETFTLHVLLDRPVYVLKQELVRIPVWGWIVSRIGAIAVDRAAGASAMRKLIAQARACDDRIIVIFPEGTRTRPGERRHYHAGVAAIYGALDLPVVPVALNSGLFWPRDGSGKRPGVITIEFLPQIPPGLPRKAFMARLEETIEEASDRLKIEAEQRFPALAAD